MRTADLDYNLPAHRIAQRPLPERDASKLLHVHADGAFSDHAFRELSTLLRPGDLLVGNDTRVRRARLLTRDGDGHSLELLVLRQRGDGQWLCLAQPAKRAVPGTTLQVADDLRATVIARSDEHPGARIVQFSSARAGDIGAAIERAGAAPLPPYIRQRLDEPERYQTVYASSAPTSAAAPTAGLHFTRRVLDALQERGVAWTTVELEVGLATFVPIRAETLEQHTMHEERIRISSEAAEHVGACRSRSGRVIAVGTTVVRTLESCANADGSVRIGSEATSLFITPGFRFRVVDGLLTNFHQPRSSLLALLDAFIGTDRRRAAYDHALDNGYRFLSFGDCMLCWRRGE